jgi:hypothetical protein
MSANPHRGEYPITLEGHEYTLRLDYEAAAAIDEQLGSILDVAQRALNLGSISMKEMAVIVCEGIKAHGRATANPMLTGSNPDRVGRMIYETGIIGCIKPVALFLAGALGGGAEAAGNGPAATEAPKT